MLRDVEESDPEREVDGIEILQGLAKGTERGKRERQAREEPLRRTERTSRRPQHEPFVQAARAVALKMPG